MKELMKKFGAFSIGPFAGAIIGFITVPLITYFISPEEYGKTSMYVLAQGTISMLIYLGMDQSFVREFNMYKDRKAKLMSNAIMIPIMIVLTLSTVIIGKYKFVSELLFESQNEFIAVLSLAIMLPFMVIENFALLNIRMEEDGIKYSYFTILLKVLNLFFTIILFFLFERSFRSVVLAIAFSEIINGTLLYFISLKKIGISIKYLDRMLIVNMLKFGLPLIPAAMLGWILTSMDKIMLRSLCSYAELGLYATAFKIVNVLGIIQTCFTLFWTPVAYRWYEEDKKLSDFEAVGKLVAFIMSCVCLSILLFKNIIVVILGSSFKDAIYIFPFLLLQPIMYTISETTAIGIGFTRSTAYNIIVSALSGCVNIALNYILIPVMGGRGAAIATGVSYIVFFWARTLISRKLWLKFKVYPYVLCSIIVAINCVIHTFFEGYLSYTITLISIIGVLIINVHDIKKIFVYIKCFYKY